jgi:outer membrane receptor protein involved in Fe transport
VVELELTSNVATVTRKEIAALPVQQLEDIVNLQAGVVDGHIRGGRAGEVQYQVDGLSVNNPFDNAATVRLDRSVLEEVQVISGTFDAEYGQAMSGVVNAVLRRGSERFQWSGEVFAGDYAFNDVERPATDEFKPASLQNYQLTLSGPTGLRNTLFLVSGRYGVRDGYVEGQRRFVNVYQPVPDSVPNHLAPIEPIAVGTTREALGLVKLSTRAFAGVELSYQAILNGIRNRPENWNFRYNVNGLPTAETFSAVHGFEWTHTLRPTTFYRFTVRQNYFDYKDMVFDDVYDKRYDQNGPPEGIDGFEHNAVLWGVSETRFIQNTNAVVFSGSLSHSPNRNHQLKGGFEWQPSWVKFGTPGHLVWTGTQYVRHIDEPENGFPAPSKYQPVFGSIYAQDDIEWNDLRFRAGLRYEYFNPRTSVPGDLANPANTIPGAPYVPPKGATRKQSLSPRLGVSYPISPRASLFFAYGHFRQMPQIGQMYSNADYSVLGQLSASSDKDFGVLGNPDVNPELSIQYQIGYKQVLKPWLGLDLTLFYKDIKNLLGSEIIITYNNAEYERLANTDFGNVIGMTLALDQRAMGLVSTALDYTWQVAKGNASDPYETAARRDANEDARPRQIVLNWDQRHTLNLTVTAARPGSFSASGVFRAASGQPYTPVAETGFGGALETNGGRKPVSFLMDLRGEKTLRFLPSAVSVFGVVYNVFDTRFFNGAVFPTSGSPYYSRTDTQADRDALADPTRYYPPRRIELGFRWEGGL